MDLLMSTAEATRARFVPRHRSAPPSPGHQEGEEEKAQGEKKRLAAEGMELCPPGHLRLPLLRSDETAGETPRPAVSPRFPRQ